MITIKFKRRLLATAVVGMALVIGAVLVVSMKGEDKPIITTNPPPDDEEPQDAQVDPADDAETMVSPDDPEDDPDDPEVPGDGNGPGDNGEDDPERNGEAHGLLTAIQAHVETMEKTEMKGQSVPTGLQNSLQVLTEVYAGVVAGEKTVDNANGHNR